jgi:DNA-directed RNA polymerase specialized sigma24 family protein
MKYTTNIPLARELLETIATELDEHAPRHSERIRWLIENHMTRRPKPRRAPVTSRKVDEAMRQAALVLLNTTNLSQDQIAAQLGVNPGRISEIYHGAKR